jgi:secreted trypsin-like serine protease
MNDSRIQPRAAIGVAVVALFAATGCADAEDARDLTDEPTGTVRQAIVNGDAESGDPAVVALLQRGRVYCTGTLIAPSVVLTAAHCVVPTPPDHVFFGSRPSQSDGQVIDVGGTRAHPAFDPESLKNDVAVVGLARKVTATRPIALSRDPFDPSFTGKAIRLVGFGFPDGSEDGSLEKRSGETKIESFTDEDFRFEARPAQTCLGDSGGPALATVEGVEVLVGIASSGDAGCEEYGRHVRVDRYASFIDDYETSYSAPVPPPSFPRSGCSTSSPSKTPGGLSPWIALLALGLVIRARRAFSYPQGTSHFTSERTVVSLPRQRTTMCW